jgi:hypothetical protein
MKKSIFFFFLLSACQSPVQENKKLTFFRACRSYGPGTPEFDSCMKEQEANERIRVLQESKEHMILQGGRDAVRDKEAEIDRGRASQGGSLMIPGNLFKGK